jgi:hypothetical protein
VKEFFDKANIIIATISSKFRPLTVCFDRKSRWDRHLFYYHPFHIQLVDSAEGEGVAESIDDAGDRVGGDVGVVRVVPPAARDVQVQQLASASIGRLNSKRILFSKIISFAVNSVADPDPVSAAFLTPGSGIGLSRISDPGSQTRIFETLVTIFWVNSSIIL